MAAETELKLRISPADARRIARLGLLRGIKPLVRQLENVYYDTPDHALAKQRIALRHRRIGESWLITVKTANVSAGGLSTRGEWEYPCAPGELDFSKVALKSLRQQLEKLRPQLAPLFATNFRRRAWMIEPHKDLSVELALDEGEILARPPEGAHSLSVPICEVEIELKHGSPLGLFEVASRLAEKLTVMPENESKAQRGQRLFRGEADAPTPAAPSRLNTRQAPLLAFQQLAHDCLNHFLANAEGVRSAENPEYIHQARVALRRLRALLKIFAPLLPGDFSRSYNEAWRYFANQLGDARDIDVLLEETLPSISQHYDGHDAIETFIEHLQAERLRVRESARSCFYAPALGQLTLRFLADLARLKTDTGQADKDELARFAEKRLEKSLQRVRRAIKRLELMTIDELHGLRILFKRLRYAGDFFSPLLSSDKYRAYAAELKAMQDVLGKINDLERALAIESKSSDAVRCELVAGWISARQRALIDDLPEIAHRFSRQHAPWETKSSAKK